MTQKAALTIFHGIIATVVTLGGMAYAQSIASEHLLAALILLVVSAVMPAVVATRVAWATGYDAGRRADQDRTP